MIFKVLYFSPSLSRLCHSSLDLWLSLLLRVTAPVSVLSNLDIFMSMCLLVQISALVSVDKTIIVIMTVTVVCASHMFRPSCLSSCHDRRCTGPPTSGQRPRAPRSRPSSSCWRRWAGAGWCPPSPHPWPRASSARCACPGYPAWRRRWAAGTRSWRHTRWRLPDQIVYYLISSS